MGFNRYLLKISIFAHWKFQKQEADDIVNDYNVLLMNSVENNDDFFFTNSPAQAIHQLGNPTSYKLWIMLFVLTLVCISGLLVELFSNSQHRLWDAGLFGVGLIAPTVWFRYTERDYRYQKSAYPLIAIFLFMIIVVLYCECQMIHAYYSLVEVKAAKSSLLQAAKELYFVVKSVGTFSATISIIGLVLAKLHDRRWCAVYTAALTVLSGSVFLFSILHDIHLDKTVSTWWIPYLWKGGTMILTGTLSTFFHYAKEISLC